MANLYFLFIYHTSFIQSSVHGHLVVSMSCLLWILPQWGWECRYLFKIVISFPLNIHPEVGFLDYVVVLFCMLRNLCIVSHGSPTSSVPGFLFHHTLSSSCYLWSFVIVILIHIRWYLIVILIGILLTISYVKHPFMYFVGHLYVFFVKISIQVLYPFLI